MLLPVLFRELVQRLIGEPDQLPAVLVARLLVACCPVFLGGVPSIGVLFQLNPVGEELVLILQSDAVGRVRDVVVLVADVINLWRDDISVLVKKMHLKRSKTSPREKKSFFEDVRCVCSVWGSASGEVK